MPEIRVLSDCLTLFLFYHFGTAIALVSPECKCFVYTKRAGVTCTLVQIKFTQTQRFLKREYRLNVIYATASNKKYADMLLDVLREFKNL